MAILTCEQVSNGHPDKICDQIADAVVTDCLQNDKNSRVAIETMIKNDDIIIAGELTSNHEPDYTKLVGETLMRIGIPNAGDYTIHKNVSKQSPDIALGVDKGGAGDQGIMFGYATNETPEMLPVPYLLATLILKRLKHMRKSGSQFLLPDAKAQVSFDYDTGRITTCLVSTQHTAEADLDEVRSEVEWAMASTARAYGYNTDFDKLINPTGRFVVGSSFADCGVTGRKLACDTYGGIGRLGGGALSGKDPSKVDRSAAYMARYIAKQVVSQFMADRCEIQLAYAIGVREPVSIAVECFGTNKVPETDIIQSILETYDLTPGGIIDFLHLKEVDYNKVSAYGHFGNLEMPWERTKPRA